MTQTPPPLTTKDFVTETQQLTTTDFCPDPEPSDTSTLPTFQELLAKYNASVEEASVQWDHLKSKELANPFAIYQNNLSKAKPQPVRWLW